MPKKTGYQFITKKTKKQKKSYFALHVLNEMTSTVNLIDYAMIMTMSQTL